HFDQTSHELRLAGGGDNLYWTVGLNYLESTQQIDRLTVLDGTFGAPATVAAIFGVPTAFAYSPAQLDNLLGPGVGINTPVPAFGGASLANLGGYAAVTPGMPGVTMFNAMGGMADWTQDTESQAIFAQISYDISDSLNLTLGLRYTEEDKDVVAITDVTYDSASRAGAGLSGGGIATAVDYSGIGPGMNLGAFMGHSLLGSLLGRYETDFDQSRSTDQLLPGVALSWTPNSDSSYYLTYSEGFKSGGFNAAIDQDPVFANVNGQRTALRDQPGVGFEFDDETGWSIELGGKHTLLDGDMTLNWNLFTSEYQDQQVSTFQGTGFVIANAGSSTSNGFEMDMQWQMSDEFKLIAALGLLDSSYDKFEGAACTALQQSAVQGLGALTSASPVTSADGCQQLFDPTGAPAGQVQDISGAQLGSDYSGSIILEYTTPISQDMMWFTQVDANFTDGYFMTGDVDPIDYQDGFQLYNIRAGIRTDNWMVMAYGRNIGDELYAQSAADLPVARGSHFIYSGTTAIYGLTVAYEF
ncbi:MAG: TonB-dependent receptor, partial [Halieaceae bacterium]